MLQMHRLHRTTCGARCGTRTQAAPLWGHIPHYGDTTHRVPHFRRPRLIASENENMLMVEIDGAGARLAFDIRLLHRSSTLRRGALHSCHEPGLAASPLSPPERRPQRAGASARREGPRPAALGKLQARIRAREFAPCGRQTGRGRRAGARAPRAHGGGRRRRATRCGSQHIADQHLNTLSSTQTQDKQSTNPRPKNPVVTPQQEQGAVMGSPRPVSRRRLLHAWDTSSD